MMLLDMDSRSLDSGTELMGVWENISSFLPPPACALRLLLSLLQSLRNSLSFRRVLAGEITFSKRAKDPTDLSAVNCCYGCVCLLNTMMVL